MRPAVMSRVPSRPANALMNAVSRPAGPAGYTCSPAGAPCLAAAITASSLVDNTSPETATPFCLAIKGA